MADRRDHDTRAETRDELDFLLRTANELATLPPDADVWGLIATRLHELVGEAVVVVTDVVAEGRFRVVAVEGLGSGIEVAMRLLGRDPIGMEFTSTLGTIDDPLETGLLVKLPEGAYLRTLGSRIPQSAARALDRALGIGDLYIIEFRSGGRRYGRATILLRRGAELARTPAIETFAHQASIAMQNRRARQALERREATLSSIFRAAPAGIGMVVDRVITRANDRLSSMTGYAPDELMGRSARILYPTDQDYDYVGQEKYDQIRRLGTGTVETRWKRKSGEVFDVLLSSSPIDPQDLGVGVTFNALDITERKRAERRLAALNECLAGLGTDHGENIDRLVSSCGSLLAGDLAVYQRFAEARPVVVASWSADPTWEGPSLCSRAGEVPTGEGCWVHRMVVPEPRGGLVTTVGHLVRAEDHGVGRMCVLFRGEFTPSEDDLRVLGIVASALGSEEERRLATEERDRLESQFRHAQKLESLGVLAGGIAHDFNNLLTGIVGNASLALDELPAGSGSRVYLEDLGVAAQRAHELVRQMLAYSGRDRSVARRVDLCHLVEEMAHLLETSISKKTRLVLDFAPEMPDIEADAAQVRQVVMNLITNASDALQGRDGVVTLSTGSRWCDDEYLAGTYLDEVLPAGRYAYVEVTDTGTGMDPEILERIFDPFFTTKVTGRGLGLAAVLGIVRANHGTIAVDSQPGVGTAFRVLFPALEPRPVTVGDPRRAAWPEALDATVLVADDEDLVRNVATRILGRLGCEVVPTRDGVEAVEAFAREPDRYDCVLLDLAMPRMDGEQCFRALRQVRADIPVLLSSGYSGRELARKYAGEELDGFVQKPYSLANLAEAIQDALDARRRRGA